ncbi:MAG: DUF418 domain-containing protein [Bacteroidia bacterium]|nr:DUF418 domain-containing protein [Bacteroidia bacterium]
MKDDSTPVLNPTTSGERIEMIDALRGFALTGVCLGNLALFSFYYCLSNEQKADLPFPVINTIISYFIYFFVDYKFWTLFTIMFGFGASIFISRANDLHKNGKALYARRLLILLIFGLIHGIFFWFGDILSEYALAGFILLLFSNKKGVLLAIWGIILGAFIPLVLKILQVKLLPDNFEIFNKLGTLTMDAYSSSYYSKVINANLVNIKIYSLYVWFLLIAALGRFMIGYWIGQTGRMYHIENYTDFFKKAMRICAWIGFPVMFITTITRILIDAEVLSPMSEWEPITCLSEIASLAIGIFYAIKFAFLYQNKKWKKRLSVFKEMGRMALTNYLVQTIINILIFNGIGFGLAGKTGPSIYILWFVILMILQIIFSKWWLSKYRFGPFEWLWRSLTYKKMQPMKVEVKL